ncbi:MAG: adenylate/guanylate cyclase domain-containing protein [Candidatus Ozemobacteraceae bacterium]
MLPTDPLPLRRKPTINRLGFRSFRGKLFFFFIGLFGLVEILTLTVLWNVQETNARTGITQEIDTASEVLLAFIANRVELLKQSSFALSRDYAFQKAFNTNDRETIRSALESLRKRVRGDLMLLIAADPAHPVIVDTLGMFPIDQPFPFSDLISTAEDTGGPVTKMTTLSGKLYNVAVVPLLAPEPIAWFCVGYLIDDSYMHELREVVKSDVSIIRTHQATEAALLTTTLPAARREAGGDAFRLAANAGAGTALLSIQGERIVVSKKTLGDNGEYMLIVQRSLDQAMIPFHRLQRLLGGLGTAGLVIAIFGVFLVARQVSKPVLALVEQARQIQKGEYGKPVVIDQIDEMGELGHAFNQMTVGLAERERVQDLLGKVVSPAIAEELLRNKDIQLGGEEREATILFSDIRNFTPLCEGRSPTQVLDILNLYLTRMSDVVDAHEGVVDKYIGDAIMAIFGAPLKHDNDPDRALQTALAMVDELANVKRELKERGFPEFNIGIGINTDIVMVGNMGSRNRLNYSVIGDGVNLASRLESASKELHHTIIVSAATLAKAKGKYRTKPLGEVKVKGKAEAIQAFALLGHEKEGLPTFEES